MKSLLSKTPLLFCAVALSVILIAGCSDKITYVPVIKSIVVSPDTVVVGGEATIQLVATDEDDANLVYYYTTTGGSVNGTGDTVTWQAPDEPGIYLAKVLVADKDGNQANDSVRLVVVKNDTTSQITGVAALPSGIDLDLANSKVRIFTSKANWVNHIVFTEVKTVGFGPIVSFHFDNVPIGTYYLDIWKDTDFGNTINTGDYYGWYGKGDILNPNPDSFLLEAGSTKVMQVQMWVIPQ
jgi:hypothetical protein